jgi:hypothetical protein
MRRDLRGRHSPWLLAVVAWLLLAGCATAPLPSGAGSASGGGSHEGKAEAAGTTAPAAPARVARSIAVVPAQYAPEVGIVAPSHAAQPRPRQRAPHWVQRRERSPACNFSWGVRPMFTVVVTARARRVDSATGVTTASRGLVYQSPRHTRDEWLRVEAAPAALSPCACLDFIPAPNYLWFRTP